MKPTVKKMSDADLEQVSGVGVPCTSNNLHGFL